MAKVVRAGMIPVVVVLLIATSGCYVGSAKAVRVYFFNHDDNEATFEITLARLDPPDGDRAVETVYDERVVLQPHANETHQVMVKPAPYMAWGRVKNASGEYVGGSEVKFFVGALLEQSPPPRIVVELRNGRGICLSLLAGDEVSPPGAS